MVMASKAFDFSKNGRQGELLLGGDSPSDAAGFLKSWRPLGPSSRTNFLLSFLLSMVLLILLSWLTMLILPGISFGQTFRSSYRWILVGSLFGMFAHEMVHYFGFRIAGVSHSDLGFGVKWTLLLPYVCLRRPVSVGVYQFGLLLPLLVLGLLPYCVALAGSLHGLAIWSGLMISASAGDVLLFLLTLRDPKTALILDRQDGVGASVIVEGKEDR